MLTHTEHAKRAGVATPCTAHHVNYGGGCLNCGYEPAPRNTAEELTACECDNTHQQNDTVCRWCYAHGRRQWNDPELQEPRP